MNWGERRHGRGGDGGEIWIVLLCARMRIGHAGKGCANGTKCFQSHREYDMRYCWVVWDLLMKKKESKEIREASAD